jgi:hypothetical protein
MRRGDLRIRHNHANPPRFERQRAPYKCIVAFLQYIWAGNGMLGLRFSWTMGTLGLAPGPARTARALAPGQGRNGRHADLPNDLD